MKTNYRKSLCTTKQCNGVLPEVYCSRETLAHGYIPHFITLIKALKYPLMFYMVKPDGKSEAAHLYIFIDPSRHPYDPKELVSGAVDLGCNLFTLEEELKFFTSAERKADFQQTCRRTNCPHCSKGTHPYQQWALKGSDFFGKVMRPM